MDILTPKGQESRRWEDRAVTLWSSHYPDIQYASTDKDAPCAVDAVLIKSGQVVGVVEQKSRPSLSVVEFNVTYKSRWLVTHKKILDGVNLAKALHTKFVGFLYLPEADILLVKTIWSPKTGWLVEFDVKTTATQATINGGVAHRENAFIDMTNSLVIYGDTDVGQTTE
jgi:hypothetical protein